MKCELYNREIREAIRIQETTIFGRKFPRELRRYLYSEYLYGNWPYGYTENGLFRSIYADARDYFDGRLEVHPLPSPMESAMEEVASARDYYCDAMSQIHDLECYIDELHELLWQNGLESSRMVHDSSGEHKGTYAEFNTLHPDEF